jgi:hypothetical protein
VLPQSEPQSVAMLHAVLPQSGPQSVAMLHAKWERSTSAPCKWEGGHRSPKIHFLMVFSQGQSLYSSSNDRFIPLTSLRGYLKCSYDVVCDATPTGRQYDFCDTCDNKNETSSK